ncbi:MAG: methylenetetrahydrofolate reductase [NAD(P)H] [Planctomycetota bacterium]|nr:MAG: methylenetetrahydrofolate reductase [NAD(P)H] [Planctomycetota bacterium]
MRIRDLFQSKPFVMSLEVFPPKTEAGDEGLYRALERLRPYDPAFVSCTYGAGGSTQNRTVDICRRIQTEFALPATSHFTCVGATRLELLDWLSRATQNGIANIMALRGDPPQGQAEFRAVEGGLANANQLVSLIREHYPNMGIGVAGYPEKHPEAPSLDVDLQNLKRKVDAGADAVFTQLFYVNENFLRFRDRCGAMGIEIPIVPGIMPITEFARIKRITALCGAVFPSSLAARLEAVQTDPQAQFEIGVEFAIEQCRELMTAGVPGMHFYVLNKSESCERILEGLGLKPEPVTA